MRRFAFVLAVMSFAPLVHAQRGGPESRPVYVRTSVEAEVVKGAPYSADVINESAQTLSDGNRIVSRTTSRVYRDGEGRTRREEDRPSGMPVVTITDPVAGHSWLLEAGSRTAREVPALRFFSGGLNANGDLERLNIAVNGALMAFRVEGGRGAPPAGGGQMAEERLTARTIEGLRAEGVRRTQTIAAGAIGNERPIVVVSEEWTAPELKTLVLSEHSDPRTGTTTYKLVNVSRGEPPAYFFQVPSDYTIVPAGGGRGGRSGPPPTQP
jgi:hypothetical protein